MASNKYEAYDKKIAGENELTRYSNDPAMYNSAITKGFIEKRQDNYPEIAEQIDLLWHAIDDEIIPGKTSQFYIKLKAVKDNNPTPTLVEE